MEVKSSNQRVKFFNVYLPIENVRMSYGSEFEFLSPNYSKFAQNTTETERFLKYVRNFF